MGFLLFTARKRLLHAQIYNYHLKLDGIIRKLRDLQQYASNISDGSVSLDDLANSPSSLFDRTLQYMRYANGRASIMAEENFAKMQPEYDAFASRMAEEERAQYMQHVKNCMYREAQTEVAKQEAKYLHQQEELLKQQQDDLQEKLKMAEAEYESCDKAEEQGIKNFAPKYVSA